MAPSILALQIKSTSNKTSNNYCLFYLHRLLCCCFCCVNQINLQGS
uniref:Uncharacterized protein n=1 Tax=Anguilla anguilla TaxID=7936 RepID=A0A0E9UWJ9_ANGAN